MSVLGKTNATGRKEPRGHFSRLPAAAVCDDRLGDRAVRVLAALGVYVDRNGVCYPAIERMAERLGVTRQAVQQQIRKLEVAGYVTTNHRIRSIGGNRSNLYQLSYPPLPFDIVEEDGASSGLALDGEDNGE